MSDRETTRLYTSQPSPVSKRDKFCSHQPNQAKQENLPQLIHVYQVQWYCAMHWLDNVIVYLMVSVTIF